jgi:hypothetical protein
VCAGWLVGAGEASGIKSVTAFYPEQAAADSNGTPAAAAAVSSSSASATPPVSVSLGE